MLGAVGFSVMATESLSVSAFAIMADASALGLATLTCSLLYVRGAELRGSHLPIAAALAVLAI